jgi:hypothetical protein
MVITQTRQLMKTIASLLRLKSHEVGINETTEFLIIHMFEHKYDLRVRYLYLVL